MSENNVFLKVPNIGDAPVIELVSWHVVEGEQVACGDELCELVTEKAAFPLEAPTAGYIVKILVNKGTQVKIGDELLEFNSSAP